MGDSIKARLIIETVDFVAFYKPPGCETISEDGKPDLVASVSSMMPGKKILPVHRLDRDTSGVQLFAKDISAEQGLAALFRRREVDKEYVAVCLGIPVNRSGTINRNLSKWQGGRRPVQVVKGGGGLEATTDYRLLASKQIAPSTYKISLLAFSPRQGRTHQIRVHASAFGYPVLGDDQYGDRSANKWAKDVFGLDRQALHSQFLGFTWKGERHELRCPLPDDLASLVSKAFPEYTPR